VEYFRDELGMSNSSSALWTNIITAATGQTSVTGNVFVAQDPETFGYDADGNLTNDGRFNYAWDAENRLTNLTSLASGPAGSLLNLAFAYDYQGRRIQKIVSTNNGSYIPEYTNRFLYDGWNLVAETAPNNSLIRSYMWGSDLSGSPQGAGGVSGLLEVSYYGSATTNCFPAFDGNGNVAALINAADGTVSANYEYGPFGEPIRMTGAMAKDNPFRFSTKYDDDESDLLYYGYRYYKPSTGTWPNQDPLGDLAFFQGHTGNSENKVQQLQRRSLLPSYLFVQNNPIVKFDLLGLYANCCCDSQTIQDGENSLISEYNQAVSYLAPYRPTPMPDDNSWSCLGVSLNIGHFMEPSPHCWTCYMADHWTKRFGFDIHDLNVIVCESHPQTGPTQKIVFDYWDLAPPAQDYSVYESSHPDQRSPDVPFKSADCSQSQKWTANNNYLNAIINPTGPIQ
jgi:RHS repeat-associated protein